MLPVMGSMIRHFPRFQFVIAATHAHSQDYYRQFLPQEENIAMVTGDTYALLQNSYAALVTSGTATLETALIGIPQVVCYKAGHLSYLIAKKLVDIKYISLVNLIMDQEVVKELIQHDYTESKLVNELKKLTENDEIRKPILEKYTTLREKLGGSGASEKAATIITEFIEEV